MQIFVTFLLYSVISFIAWSVCAKLSPNGFNFGQVLQITLIFSISDFLLKFFGMQNVFMIFLILWVICGISLMKIWDLDEAIDAIKFSTLHMVLCMLLSLVISEIFK